MMINMTSQQQQQQYQPSQNRAYSNSYYPGQVVSNQQYSMSNNMRLINAVPSPNQIGSLNNKPQQWTVQAQSQTSPNVVVHQQYQSSSPNEQQYGSYSYNSPSYYRTTPPYYSSHGTTRQPGQVVIYQQPTYGLTQPGQMSTQAGNVIRNYPIPPGLYSNNNYYNSYRSSGQDNSRLTYSVSNQNQFYEQESKPIQYRLQIQQASQQQQHSITQHLLNNDQQPHPSLRLSSFDLKSSNYYSQPSNVSMKSLDQHRLRFPTLPRTAMPTLNRNSLQLSHENKPNNIMYQQQNYIGSSDKISNINQHFKSLPTKNINNIHLRQALGVSIHEESSKLDENIVEKTKPVFKKIKKINSIGSIDCKKIIMSLKSGLLAETTWALDCLNILSSNGTFRIQTIPNILTYLIEYYKCFLNTIFDDLFSDTESDFQLKIMKKKRKPDNSYVANYKGEVENLIQKGDRIYLLDSTNYTFKSRNGLPVKVKKDYLNKNLSNQIEYSLFEDLCDHQYLENGNTFTTAHIIQTMDPLWEIIPFIEKEIKGNQRSNQNEFEDEKQVNQQTKIKKRKFESDNEAEKYEIDSTLCPRRESLELLLKRCLCISNIIRNLSFLPENARLMTEYPALLLVLARLLSYYHKHHEKKTFAIIVEELEKKNSEKENQEAHEIFKEFSFETLHIIRMNSFVTLSNLSEFLDLSNFSDKIILPLFDSLLHWIVCQSSYARDVLPPDNLSCQMQALEIIAKLSIHISNIDLILATPPFDRIENFYQVLVQLIGKDEDQVLRELSLVVLSHFASYDILSARIIMHLDYSITNLLGFIEQNEFFNRTRGIYLSNPKLGQCQQEQFPITHMLKHAANTLRTLASDCEHNDLHLIKKYENRLVDLTMSIFLETEVTQILADLVFILSNRKSK